MKNDKNENNKALKAFSNIFSDKVINIARNSVMCFCICATATLFYKNTQLHKQIESLSESSLITENAELQGELAAADFALERCRSEKSYDEKVWSEKFQQCQSDKRSDNNVCVQELKKRDDIITNQKYAIRDLSNGLEVQTNSSELYHSVHQCDVQIATLYNEMYPKIDKALADKKLWTLFKLLLNYKSYSYKAMKKNSQTTLNACRNERGAYKKVNDILVQNSFYNQIDSGYTAEF